MCILACAFEYLKSFIYPKTLINTNKKCLCNYVQLTRKFFMIKVLGMELCLKAYYYYPLVLNLMRTLVCSFILTNKAQKTLQK